MSTLFDRLSVHAYTAAVIQATSLLRVPNCIMAGDIRHDFESSFNTISHMAPASRVAKRALPMLIRLKHRVDHDSDGSSDQQWVAMRPAGGSQET